MLLGTDQIREFPGNVKEKGRYTLHHSGSECTIKNKAGILHVCVQLYDLFVVVRANEKCSFFIRAEYTKVKEKILKREPKKQQLL